MGTERKRIKIKDKSWCFWDAFHRRPWTGDFSFDEFIQFLLRKHAEMPEDSYVYANLDGSEVTYYREETDDEYATRQEKELKQAIRRSAAAEKRRRTLQEKKDKQVALEKELYEKLKQKYEATT